MIPILICIDRTGKILRSISPIRTFKISLCGILLLSQTLLLGCSGIAYENRFTPRLDDYKSTGYKAESRGASADSVYMELPRTDIDYPSGAKSAPMFLLSGDKPELVLTSSEYRMTIEASLKSERLLTIGPCILIPLPIIPVLFYKHDFHDNLRIYGNITSLKGQNFALNSIDATIGLNRFNNLKFITKAISYDDNKYSVDIDALDNLPPMKQEKITFRTVVPLSVQNVKNIDVDVHITEDNGKEIQLPQIHFYSSSAVVWAVCVM